MSLTNPLILSVKMDAATFEYFDDLRRRYFPPKRNFLSAHITLFHHLPGDQISNLERDLQSVTANYANIELDFFDVRFLGRGSAVEVQAPQLIALRADLAAEWREFLTAQDQQKFKPHITVQNKCEPGAAKSTYEKLKYEWQPRKGTAVGLQLWHYLGGPWQLANEFHFGRNV